MKQLREIPQLFPASTVWQVIDALDRYDDDPRRPLTDEQLNALGVNYRIALSHMLNGQGSKENWGVCVCSLNIAVVLADNGIGEEYLPIFIKALEGAYRAELRAGRTGKWGFDGPAITDIKDAFEIHDAQLKVTTKYQCRDAIQEVHRRQAEGIAYKEAA